MHYVSVEELTKAFGIKPLFKNISFNINKGDKIGLIAQNGTGKSTLLKIIGQLEQADEGKLWVNKEVTVAYFEQEPILAEDKNIVENIFSHNHPIINVIKEYEWATATNNTDTIGQAIIKMDELDAWNFEAKVKQILSKLNISNLSQAVNTLSGGQKKRIALAKTLIDIGFGLQHTLLIMDEPTNHLDVNMVEWLEHYLNGSDVTLILVSHDRYFLDNVCNQMIEIENGQLFQYSGDYDDYLVKKAARIENTLSTIDKAKNLYKRELEWMRKQPRARTTKSKSRQDNFYEVEAKAKQQVGQNQVMLQMKMSRLGGKVIELKKIYKAYNENIILKGFDYNFNKGQRIGIIGKNGVGKSTFINMLQQLEPVDSGKVVIGDTVIFGYYAQQHLEVKQDVRVIEYVKNIAENFQLAKGGSLSAAQFLELFLFSPEQQYTYISKLSGGEKRRLQLLSVLFKNPNVLILDEPTNDLDLPTLSVLENFLQEFAGVLIIISHDRYFMDKLVDSLLVFEGEGVIREFMGNYSEYRLEQNVKQETETSTTKPAPKPTNATISSNNNTATKKKLSFNEKREFEMIEKELPILEAERVAINEAINNGNLPFEALQEQINALTKTTEKIEHYEMRWLELSELAND
jgi:ABC transport system ATP-binding/permease protein